MTGLPIGRSELRLLIEAADDFTRPALVNRETDENLAIEYGPIPSTLFDSDGALLLDFRAKVSHLGLFIQFHASSM
jgi:hypothetical protein